MPRKGENIYKRHDGRWEGRYQAGRKPDGSVKYRSVYAKTYREVKELLIQRKSLQYHDPPKCVLFVKDLMAIWLNLRAIEVKESTYNQYETIIRSHIVPFFDGMRISSLTPEIIADFISTLQKNGRTDKNGGLCRWPRRRRTGAARSRRADAGCPTRGCRARRSTAPP